MFNNFTETELANEQWKAIEGYDGLYEVSSLGRVRSKHSGEWKVLRPGTNMNGYLFVILCKDGNRKNCMIHRLVAQAFIPNDDESKTIINHRNSIRDCNRVDNIEWCDYQYNNTYNDIQFLKKNSVRSKVKYLYNPNLTYEQNLELFIANGIECSKETVFRLRKDLGITRKYTKRS